MKAVAVSLTHGPSLELVKKPIPPVREEQCLVQLRAAALNRRDFWISQGKYPGIKPGVTLGSDGCGVVVDGDPSWIDQEVIINPNVGWGNDPDFQSADYSILGMPTDGTLAGYIVVSSHRLHPKPVFLSDHQAAAIPLAGLTAYRTVFTKAGVQPGHLLLVTGIGGGVAQFAMNFALAAGARVVVTSGTDEKIAMAMAQGATTGFNYSKPTWVTDALQIGQYDAIIDSAGGLAINDYLKLIKPGGKIVSYGSTAGKPKELDLYRLFWSQASLMGSTMGNDEEFDQMVAFVEAHQIRPVVDRVFGLQEGVDAVRFMGESSHYGKIVIDIQ